MKRAEAFKILNYAIWRMLFLTIFFFMLYLIVHSQLNINIDTSDLRATIFTHRLLYADSGISHYSDLAMINVPGMIDKERMKDDILARQFDNSSSKRSARLVIENLQTSSQNQAYLNKEWFERHYPLSKFKNYHGNLFWRYAIIDDGTPQGARLLIKTVEAKE